MRMTDNVERGVARVLQMPPPEGQIEELMIRMESVFSQETIALGTWRPIADLDAWFLQVCAVHEARMTRPAIYAEAAQRYRERYPAVHFEWEPEFYAQAARWFRKKYPGVSIEEN